MRSDRDKRTDQEREIDEFLARFEIPFDELSADAHHFLETKDTTKITAVQTFYGDKYREVLGKEPMASLSLDENKETTASVETETSEETNDPDAGDTAAITESSSDEVTDTADVVTDSADEVTDSAPETPPVAVKKKKRAHTDWKAVKNELFFRENKGYDPDSTEEYVTYKGRNVKNTPYRFSIFKLFRDFVLLGVMMVLCFMLYALVCVTLAPKIDPTDIYSSVDTSSMIYDDEGNEIDSVYYTQNRQVVKFEDMPENLIDSFIAIEDKTFWKHHGFNWVRMIGAVLSSFRGEGRISGTSTITQQLARNVYLSDIKSVRSIRRKIIEMHYASQIERTLSKQQIIEAYLNSIYLGYGCYGVDSAARTYFSKEVRDLDLIECASLAALPKAPDDYALLKMVDNGSQVSEDAKIVQRDPDTIVTNDVSKNRRNLTLGLMKDQNMITDEEYTGAVDQSLNAFINPTIATGSGNNSYFHEYLVETVINDLMDQYGMEYADAERTVYTKGLKIYSTMDSTAQNVVANEFKDASNFPSISAIYKTDADGNMLNNDNEIALYNYQHFFDENGNFILGAEDVSINADGSVTIFRGRNLNIYETQVQEGTDYSLEFKNYYVVDDNQLYSIQGGYINVPSTYKSLDESGNLVISADYFSDYAGDMIKDGTGLIITGNAYSLSSRVMQPQGAMVIVGVGTGEVKAMVGGRTFRGQKLLNRALNARQPGSSIKPLAVYGAALQKSYDLAAGGHKWPFINFDIDKQGNKGWGDYVTVHSSIEDEKCHIENRDWPENFTRSFSGENTFKTAIQQSINTCAVKLELQVGHDYSLNQVQKFGISTLVDDESEYANDLNPAALALGAMVHGVEPIEMALAYAAFPAGGKVNTPVCYYKVVDRNGEVILEGKSEQTEALNEGVAFIMTDVLQSVVKANGYAISQVATGGKTGTTNDKYDIWFDGFTPTYAASLWIGTDQNVEMTGMSYIAANLWGKIMGQIPKACQGAYPAQPANVIRKGSEYFTAGTETGLTTYKSPERLKKEKEEEERKRKEAYNKWLIERESHKRWVVDAPAVYEDRKVIDQQARGPWDESVKRTRTVVDKDAWDETVTDPETGEEKIIHHDAITHEETYYETVHHDAVPEISHIERVKVTEEIGHWEYDPGYRDGDFVYKGNT